MLAPFFVNPGAQFRREVPIMDDATFFAGLRPDLAAFARAHRQNCQAHGISIVFTSGWRSPTEQTALYQKGRTLTPTGWVVVDASKVVTNATPANAPHCRGAAYDCAPVDARDRIDWNRLDLFQAVSQFAPEGLVWGGTWVRLKDLPHYELPGWRLLPIKWS